MMKSDVGEWFDFRTLLLVIKMVVEYCQCVDDTPVLTAELLTKLCEILKVRRLLSE